MKSKKMITGLAAALFCLVLVGVSFAQEYEGDGPEFGFTVERNIVSTSPRLDPDANWRALAALPYEGSLENTVDYQLNPDKYIHIKDGQIEVATPQKADQLDPDANWRAMAAMPYEASLKDTVDYQLNKDKYIYLGQMEVATPSKTKSDEHCAQVNNHQSDGC